jgi:hypothetical protein
MHSTVVIPSPRPRWGPARFNPVRSRRGVVMGVCYAAVIG